MAMPGRSELDLYIITRSIIYMVTEVLNYFNETYSKLVYDQIILLHVIIFQEKQRGNYCIMVGKQNTLYCYLCLCNSELLYIIFIVVTIAIPI